MKSEATHKKLDQGKTIVAIDRAGPAIRFDPRYVRCQPCERVKCAVEDACLCDCHGGWRLAQRIKGGALFLPGVSVPVCFLCACAASMGPAKCATPKCECHTLVD